MATDTKPRTARTRRGAASALARPRLPDLSTLPGRPGFTQLARLATCPLVVAGTLLDAQRASTTELTRRLLPQQKS
jgi:hypothetical protein